MNQRVVDDLSRAIYRAMPRNATSTAKDDVNYAAQIVFAKHFDLCNAEANELDEIIGRKDTEIARLRAEIAELRARLDWAEDASDRRPAAT